VNVPLLEIKDLSYRYPDGTAALDSVSVALETGEKVALLGPTGAGKSTLLLHLNGLILPSSGRVVVDGHTVSESTVKKVRRVVGLVFQDPDDQLFMPTLLEDVAFGPLNEGLPAVEAEAAARKALRHLGLADSGDRAAHHLSGGERRLAALATVLVSVPKLLALDEPTSSLDARGKRSLVELLRNREETLLIATHDLEVAGAACSRAVVLESGCVAYDGRIHELLADRERLEHLGLAASLE
jgi:cobalt/nickel transport system ATP-binding protein